MDTPPLLIVGPYSATQREAHARGLTGAQWRHISDVARVQGTARGSRYVVVGLREHWAQAGRLTEILNVLRAHDATEEAPVTG